ncbi:hypothetical protein ACGF13_03135 [Kitasatospora sp. NPDC048286]|uniref:hypothetical protein n=1 Tax=Kitasatospora sp. NPDC048286 TaxID=3364047 RepID=UPI00371BF010
MLYAGGYTVSTAQFRPEPTEPLNANQVSTGQRFFGASPPDPADWNDLNIQQAAADHHHVVEALCQVYPGDLDAHRRQQGRHGRLPPPLLSAGRRRLGRLIRAPNSTDDRENSAYLDLLPTVGTPECHRALQVAQLPVYTDSVANQFVPHFYQSTQLGYSPVKTAHLAGLLHYPGATKPRTFVPRDIPLRYKPQAIRNVDSWVRPHGNRLMFANGATDPAVAEPFRLGLGTRDSHLFQVPGGTHTARIAQLPAADAATATLRRWAATSWQAATLRDGP